MAREALLEHAVALARSACDDLAARDGFSATVFDKLAAYTAAGQRPGDPCGTWPTDKLPWLMAENVVNNIAELPTNRTDHAFWAQFGEDFRALGSGGRLEALRTAVQGLTDYAVSLREMIASWRFALCQACGIPPS